MYLYKRLEERAAGTEEQGEDELGDQEVVRSRTRLGVLRRLLAGGLLTDDRMARHYGKIAGAACECGEAQTVEH
eukprot:13687922-Heterocapsa_arctica.AAC.1